MFRSKLTALLMAITLSLTSCGSKRYHVPTGSMEPTIPAGTDVVVDLRAYQTADPVRWEIVTFEPPAVVYGGSAPPGPKQVWIMRVIGLPGETIEYSGSEILIGGTPLKIPAGLKGVSYVGLEALGRQFSSSAGKITLAKDEYFVLGDNTINSNDSRMWGALARVSISGRYDPP